MDKNKEAKRQTINLVNKKDFSGQSMLVVDELESMEESENGVKQIYLAKQKRLSQFSFRAQNFSFNSPDIERNLFPITSQIRNSSKDDEIALTSADLKERIGEILKVVNLGTISAEDVRTQLEEDTGSDLSSRKDEIIEIINEVMNETEEEDSPKKKESVKAKTIPKARKRNAENDMNTNAKRQSICSLHEVVDETEINQDPEKPGKVTKVIYHFIVV